MLEFFLWVILIYFVLRMIWRYVIPFFLKRYVRKVEKRFDRMNQTENHYNSGKEGDVHIHHVPEDTEKEIVSVDDDDYVDFEELNNNDQTDKPHE